MKNKAFKAESFGSANKNAKNTGTTYDTAAKIKELGLDPYSVLYSSSDSNTEDDMNEYTKDEIRALKYIYDHEEVPDELKQKILNNPNKPKPLESYDATIPDSVLDKLLKKWKKKE
jgi:hypothetical protein